MKSVKTGVLSNKSSPLHSRDSRNFDGNNSKNSFLFFILLHACAEVQQTSPGLCTIGAAPTTSVSCKLGPRNARNETLNNLLVCNLWAKRRKKSSLSGTVEMYVQRCPKVVTRLENESFMKSRAMKLDCIHARA